MALRNENDFYPTPPWCYQKLEFDYSKFSSALEPCMGDGRIAVFLEDKGLSVTGIDLSEGIDYLTYTPVTKPDIILTNPPFSLAKEFIIKAISESDTVVMLLRINFLGSQARHKFWLDYPITGLQVLSKRPSFTGKGTDATEYAWFIWDKTDKLPKGIKHIL
jgi:hypothetical protein